MPQVLSIWTTLVLSHKHLPVALREEVPMTHKTGLQKQSKTFALLIGVGDYPHPRFASLPATVRDVQAIAAILADPDRCGYPRDNVQVITGSDATAANIRAALESLAQSTNSQSTVLLYFSGHGGRALESGHWRTYLCPREADPDDLAHTAISGDEFSVLLTTIPARKLLVMLDACHAAGSAELKATDGTVVWKAGLPDSYYEALSQGTGRVVIASSREDQFSYVRPQGDVSLFTHRLLQALSGKAAVRGDGLIHVLDVFHYVNEAVQADEPKQTPILKVSDLDLNFPIALDRGGKGIGPAPAAADVAAIREQIVRDPIAGARALSDYLATRSAWATKRNEVDLKRAELEHIQHDLDLFGPNPSDQAAKHRAVYFLLRVCLELERSEDTTVSNGARVESPFGSHLPENSEPGGESEWNTATVRQLLTAALDDEGLTELCYDHFRPVYEGFSSGMSKKQKIQRLLDYCIRYGQLEKLLKLVEERNPAQYERFSPHIAATPPQSILPPFTVTHSEPSQTGALPRITSNILLTDRERALLQHVHRNCREVLVEKEFGGGYSGARVLLALPIARDGRRAARKVTKLGTAAEMRRERDKYERYVGPNLPFCVARVESERYSEQDDQASLNYIFVGGGALGQAVVLEEYYRSAFPDAVERIVETLNELLGKNLGPRWYGQRMPLNCFFAAEYGRHLVEHLRLRLRPESSDRIWPVDQAPQPPARARGYRRVGVNAIPHEHGEIQPGKLLLVEGLLVTRIKHSVVTLEDPDGQGIVVRVESAPESLAPQGLELESKVSVRGKVVYNRRDRMEEIIRAIFPDLLPGGDSESVQLPCEPEEHPGLVYPNPLQIYPRVLGRVLEGEKSYVHGDLNLCNVLVDESGRGWLIDFAMVEERHNLFDFIKLETFLRLTVLGRGDFAFSLGDYLRFEEALAAAALGKSTTPPRDPHLRFAYEVILAIRRIARKYMGPEPDFRNEYFPALFLYCLAVTKYYRNYGVQAAGLVFATACVLGRYLLGGGEQTHPPVLTSSISSRLEGTATFAEGSAGTPQTVQVSVLRPQPGQFVRNRVPLEGTIAGATKDTILHTVVFSEALYNYHPQSGQADIDLEAGTWSTVTYVGGADVGSHTGERFRILVVKCSVSADKSLGAYLASASERGWPGLPKLPRGCEILAEVSVIRNDHKAIIGEFVEEPVVASDDHTSLPRQDASSFDIAAIRQRLTNAFDDPGLDAFCMDHFPQVYDKFSRGMRRDEKITLLDPPPVLWTGG